MPNDPQKQNQNNIYVKRETKVAQFFKLQTTITAAGRDGLQLFFLPVLCPNTQIKRERGKKCYKLTETIQKFVYMLIT